MVEENTGINIQAFLAVVVKTLPLPKGRVGYVKALGRKERYLRIKDQRTKRKKEKVYLIFSFYPLAQIFACVLIEN